LPVRRLQCTAEGRITPDQEGGYHLKEIVLQPHFEMEGDPKAHDQAIMRAVKLAEQRCIISRAVKGTVTYQIQPSIKS
ncbi:OsmC family protein, partial [Candidatus Acetothermia bacterium]|nr:OsmC family protein [Candidatus Acetothermia bacterium]